MLSLLAGWLAVTTAYAGKVSYAADGHAYNPVFSPDGRTIAFEVNPYQGNVDLYLAGLAGTEPKGQAVKVSLPGTSSKFGGRGHVAASPVWHPDGLVIFEASNPGGKYRLYYRQGLRGSAAELISSKSISGNLTSATLSPDGHRLAFVTDASGQAEIQIRDTQTNKTTPLTRSPEAESYPMFSTDGKRLVFQRKRNSSEDVFEIEVTSGVERQVAGGGGDQTRPIYGADGAVLFFDGSRGEEHWDLVSIVNGKTRVLAKDVRLPLRARPALSADGRYVAFAYADPTKSKKVMIARVDGSRTVALETPFTAVGEPAFGQQGPRTLLAYTALPGEGSDWRFLYVVDVSDKVDSNAKTP
ncbi:MAG: hypothetical protein AAGA48_37660 [Myxococcota bacterium]